MLKTDGQLQYLPVYEALASEVRWKIMEFLVSSEKSVKEIAAMLQLSPSIVTMHVRKLEAAGIISSRRVRREGGTHKLCFLVQDSIQIMLPSSSRLNGITEHHIPVGHYTGCEVYPTCGIGTLEKELGVWDDPGYFHDPERVQAAILWFAKGYVEYKLRNPLKREQIVEQIEISMEIASEAPGLRDTWLSDITFTFNGTRLGTWTSPADFGRAARGKYTPEWWHRNLNQYGLLKTIRMDRSGTYMDEERMSDVTIADLNLQESYWTLRFAVEEDAAHVGGLTLYGAGFGNHDQDIVVRTYYV
ncbi:ArsR/SmtB family transcription factor [Paenibacillus bovis]|uniref:Transcriptional regulator n=1 Tax=Paenibacillus bovis TaxID=1616788 RepID=A0A172ZHE4_9BACL|nr:ArsR family transcriptional regulator [Paenibacillus bovis]ANF97056.1 transcriptional regulator [Paenibacillus bovis]